MMKKLIVLILMIMTGSVCMAQSNVVWRDSGPEYDSPKHLTFLGVEINGKCEDVKTQLMKKGVRKVINKDFGFTEYKYVFKNLFDDLEWNVGTIGDNYAGGVYITLKTEHNQDHFWEMMDWVEDNYQINEKFYFREQNEMKEFFGPETLDRIRFELKDEKGTIYVKEFVDGHGDYFVVADFVDEKNRQYAGKEYKSMEYKNVTEIYRTRGNCYMATTDDYEQMEFVYATNKRVYRISTGYNDCKAIKQMLWGDPKYNDVYIDIIQKYLDIASKECSTPNWYYGKDNIMEEAFALKAKERAEMQKRLQMSGTANRLRNAGSVAIVRG